MRNKTPILQLLLLMVAITLLNQAKSQTCEWRLTNATHSPTDPDGAGPATGSVTFVLQVRAISGTVNNVTGLSLGWSWQSTKAMIPTTNGPGTGTTSPGCTSPVNTPGHIVLSSSFSGWQYNTINECFINVQTAGTENFDRISIGTLENGTINLTTTFVDVFTVTLWTIGTVSPEGGFTFINGSFGGTPSFFPNYEISDNAANIILANSLTHATPLRLGSIVTGVFNPPSPIKGVFITLYPVPAKGMLNLSIKSDRVLETEFQVFEINGRLLQTVNARINNGNTSLVIDVESLPAGQYILSCRHDQNQINKKFTIVK